MDELSPQTGRKRWLIVAGYGVSPQDRRSISLGEAPKVEYLELGEMVSAEIIGQRARPGRRPGRHRMKAAQFASSLQAFVRRRFDVIYTTGEDISYWLAPALRRSGWRGVLITVVHNCGSANARRLMRLVPKTAKDRFVCFCRAQENILVDELGAPRTSVIRLVNPVDHRFFTPSRASAADRVFAAGNERRDYGTLARAAAGLDLPITISASGFLADAESRLEVPPNMSVLAERVSHGEIKALYDSARLVVVPLHASDYAAGVNGVLEAMAMGKPVIATRSPGIEDYVADGAAGRVVDPADPAALRRAIEELWSRPGLCAEIGRRNRAWVEQHAAIPDYCARVRALQETALPPVAVGGLGRTGDDPGFAMPALATG